MAELTILHNPNCSTSRAAVDAASQAGTQPTIVQYLKTPLAADELGTLIDKLQDAPNDLVRRDKLFGELNLSDADVQTRDQVIAVLTEHPKLMQRPVLVAGDAAIIGRPKDRVPEFLAQISQ